MFACEYVLHVCFCVCLCTGKNVTLIIYVITRPPKFAWPVPLCPGRCGEEKSKGKEESSGKEGGEGGNEDRRLLKGGNFALVYPTRVGFPLRVFVCLFV